MKSLKNIPLKDLRKYLKKRGWRHIRTKGGHEIYAHEKANRSIPLQSHVSPVPERIVMQFGKALGLSKKELIKDMEAVLSFSFVASKEKDQKKTPA